MKWFNVNNVFSFPNFSIDKSTEAYKNAFKMHQKLWKEKKTFQMLNSTQEKVMSKLDTLDQVCLFLCKDLKFVGLVC
jgi:hypothetical protein